MTRCGDCKHWGRTEKLDGGNNGAVCALLSDPPAPPEGRSAFAFAAHGYDFFTGPDFGCVLGEAKEPAPEPRFQDETERPT
jgi:hypothetical protein